MHSRNAPLGLRIGLVASRVSALDIGYNASPNLHIGNLPLGIGAGSGTLGSALDARVQLEPDLQRSNGPLGLQVGLGTSRGVSARH